MRILNHVRSLSLICALAAFAGGALDAQVFQAQITGLVRDSSGAVVPGATLTASNIANGTSYRAVTNSSGVYLITSLPPGQYRLSCTQTGFRTFQQSSITLQVGQSLELNIELSVGDTKEQVVVTGQAPPLETTTATLGQVVTTRSIENLPLDLRDPLALVGLTAGAVFGSAAGYNPNSPSVGRNYQRANVNIAGGITYTQEILVDGAADTTPDNGFLVADPPVDSVQEFKVQANSYDAEFGRTSGGIVSMVTKSGQNEYHGVGYMFERQSIFDANNFFNNRAGIRKPTFRRHQFGANLGGPVLKNKWFFFGDYEGLRHALPGTIVGTVPTAEQRQGDFSKTFAANGALIQVFDPATLTTLANGTRQRTAFAGNIIPQDRFDPVARKVLSFIPLPNAPGNPITQQNNYVASRNAITDSTKWSIRNDVNFSEATRMFVRFYRQDDSRNTPAIFPPPAGNGNITWDAYTQAVTDLTHIFTPALLLDVNLSFTRGLAIQHGQFRGFDLTSLGLPASYAALMDPQFPSLTVADSFNTPGGAVQSQPRNIFAAHARLNYLRNKHSLKYGVEWRALHFNEAQWSNASGSFAFSRLFTQGPNPVQASATAGFGLASFLLGAASSGTATQNQPISTQATYYAAFVQDDWRVSDRLTLNLGLRWDLTLGNREKYDRLAYFDPNAANPLGPAAGLPNLRGLVQWVGQEHSRNQQETDWKALGPRAGLAYRVSNKTVVRAGYGIMYVPRRVQGKNLGALEAADRPTPMVTSIDGVSLANTLSNPFPQGLLPSVNDRNPLANIGAQVVAPTHDYTTGYAQTWNIGLQRELPFGVVAGANYWGNKGTHLQTGPWNINQLPDQYLALGNALNNQVRNPFNGLIAAGALSGPTISLRQSLLPFPEYATDSGVQQQFVPAGNSIYHAFAIQAERRLASNFTVLTSFTVSKSIDDIGAVLDVYNRRISRAISSMDVPRQFLVSWVYQLPFGKGRSIGGGMGTVANAILGGWDVNGIYRYQKGFPAGVAAGSVNNGHSAHLDHPTINRWFDTSVFSLAAPFTFGTLGAGRLPDVRSDGVNNLDAVLTKRFRVSVHDHAIEAQIRAEAYNLFNRAQFGGPGAGVGSQTFGQVTSQANNPRDLQFGLKLKF